ncbi:hypothetical protein BDP27DRAFT_1526590 [Rhodocollybia butyracea]|uniref:Uncharacterized protein n=1 Tax=Rhodocollybia butyracea TaxID=206335 RepID=A0A9P5UER3_9AGAR|nr:hypothetical protein BDP27DRAFT_1526590 [Rhodocollybia butyracea]
MSNQDVDEEPDKTHIATQQGLREVQGRSDTENLLSYYQSALADSHYESNEAKTRPTPSRQLSSISTSDSDYSDSSHSDYSNAVALRRTSIPSEGGSDRRRIAIVEMDTFVETAKRKSSLRSRKGTDTFGSLALVAPPDASPDSYSKFTLPSMVSIEGNNHLHEPELKTHQRSQSDVTSPKKSPPRDVGIVGTARQPIVLDLESVDERGMALRPPVFIHPQSRSPSPAVSTPSSLLPPTKRRSTGQSITVVTPEIGAGKAIDAPVASPVVVNLDSEDLVETASPEESPALSHHTPPTIEQQSSFAPSSYLNYKPGIHATAGPLPPPPRAAFVIDTQSPPPPRPPRLNSPISQQTSHARRGDIDVMRQALQLPASVAKTLAARPMAPSKPPARKTEIPINTGANQNPSESLLDGTSSGHHREGAFSPSSEDTSPESLTISVAAENKNEAMIPPSLRRVDTHLQPSHEELVQKGPPITEVYPLKPPLTSAAYSISADSSSSSFGAVQPLNAGFSGDTQARGSGDTPILPDSWVDVRSVKSSSLSSSPRTSVEHPRLSAEHSHHARTIVSHSTSNSLSVDGHATSMTPSPSGSSSASPAISRSHSPSRPPQSSRSTSLSPAPSPPPKSFRHSITTGFKRMSLPRSPSGRTLGRGSNEKERSSYEDDISTHPLPDIPQAQLLSFQSPVPFRDIQSHQQVTRPHAKPVQPVRKMRKIDPNPAAMFCSEVTATRSSGERRVLYAQKINELWTYDCGLEEWMDDMRDRGRGAAISLMQVQPTSPVYSNFSPSVIPFTTQPRQTSQSSVITEATFPRRPDASAATDLSFTVQDVLSPPTGPPPLPYPSLASGSRAPLNTSMGSISDSPVKGYKSLMTPLTPASKTGAFFASLGRKASVSRREKAAGMGLSVSSPSVPPSRLIKANKNNLQNIQPPPSSAPSSVASPSVPGGPRAPPNRMQRSQTIMIAPMPSESSGSLGRRPSLYNIPSADSVHHSTPSPGYLSGPTVRGGPRSQSSSPSKPPSKVPYLSSPQPESSWDQDFRRQVDKLSDLMPHADRTVLAGYLRRAGQDILAIGQYLEDEKNGCLRKD